MKSLVRQLGKSMSLTRLIEDTDPRSKRSGFRTLRSFLLILAFLIGSTIAGPAQSFTTLFSFSGNDGAHPNYPLVEGPDGNFYGATQGGEIGSPDGCDPPLSVQCGTVFKITPTGQLTTLYSFCSQWNGQLCTDGETPLAGLVLGVDGNFYGTTSVGGSNSRPAGGGTVFQITPTGQLTTIYSFCAPFANGVCTDGSGPYNLAQGADGNLYGFTVAGGNPYLGICFEGCGTFFEITPTGQLTTLISWGASGFDFSTLVQGPDGKFYGTSVGTFGNAGCAVSVGGSGGCGGVFSFTVDTNPTVTTLYSFCSQTNCTDGSNPGPAALTLGTNGNFYGTTQENGGIYTNVGDCPFGCGTVFEITPTGELTTLHDFAGGDGGMPIANLVLDPSNGNFYGATTSGGANNYGTIFQLTQAGTLTTLYNFCPQFKSQGFCSDGFEPNSLVQGANGNSFGTTEFGGTSVSAAGTVFELNLSSVGTVPTATVLGLSLSSVPAGSAGPVTMTATVSPSSGSGTPTGTVTFYNSSTEVGTGILSGGVATYNYNPSSLAAGAYSITASYGGDSNFSASTSSPQTLTVTATPTYTLSVNPTSVTITAGQTGQATFTVTPQNGFDSQVSFSCSGLPAEATCSFNPTSVTPSGGNAATSTLTITTTAASAAAQKAGLFSTRAICALLLLPGVLVVWGGISTKRQASRGLRVLALLMILGGFGAGLTSCGGSSGNGSGGGGGAGNTGTPAGAYTVTVTASASGTGTSSQTANLTVTITQ
jgi:uncharacterized repeat protein (TIGR03803 family)